MVEVGAKVREYKLGDKVMVFNWCNTFADYYVVPVSGLQPIPDGLDMDLASLGEPIACAMYSALTCGAPTGTWSSSTVWDSPEGSSPRQSSAWAHTKS